MATKAAFKKASTVKRVTKLVAKEKQPDVDAVINVVVAEGDGSEAFVSALRQVASYYSADLLVGWLEELTSEDEEPEIDDEEDEEEAEEEEDEEYEDEEGDGDAYTEDDLAELESDDLRAILEDMGIELDGRFGRQKAITAILEEQ